MTFLEQLQSHRGGLIRLKELYWYGGRGWDKSPDQICLLLDAAAAAISAAAATAATAAEAVAALLLIDGCPHWVWIGQEDVELL
jgi:hypothetical protein